jgi:EmrB/QacA subfamily drug resistance transporter
MSAIRGAARGAGSIGRRGGDPPKLVALRSKAGVALLATTVLASAVGILAASVVNVAIPAIGRDQGSGVSGLQWVLTGYLVTVVALMPLSGALADRLGRRRVLAAGLVVMLVGSALCAVAPTIAALIAARITQGVGGAMVVPSSLALLVGTLRASDRARGIGVWSGLATSSSAVGLCVGGWLVDHATWRAVFLLDVPLIVAGLAVLRRVPDTSDESEPRSLDAPGAVLAVFGLGALIYALGEGPSQGWGHAPIVASAVVGVVSLVALVATERRLRAPMIRISLFRSGQFDAINVTTFLFDGAAAAVAYLVILQCELRLGYSAAQAGEALIPASAVFLVIAPLSGRLVARVGARWLMVAGMVCVAGAFVWLSRAQPGDRYMQAILPGPVLWGLGLGVSVTPLTAAVLAAVRDVDLGEASAINDTASRIGGVIAVAIAPALIGWGGGRSLADALVRGFEPAMIAMGGLCIAGAVLTAVLVSDERTVGPQPCPASEDPTLPPRGPNSRAAS